MSDQDRQKEWHDFRDSRPDHEPIGARRQSEEDRHQEADLPRPSGHRGNRRCYFYAALRPASDLGDIGTDLEIVWRRVRNPTMEFGFYPKLEHRVLNLTLFPGFNPKILKQNVENTDVFTAVTNDDETNILASLLAKRAGSQRAITLVNNSAFEPIIPSLGIDVLVNPRNITVSTILQHVRRGKIHSVHTLQEGFGELIEAEAVETSSLIGVPLREASLPDGVIVGAIVREDEVTVPRGSTVVNANDRVVLFAATEAVKQVEQLFSVGLEFF
mgnify:CR=1 FL=1